MEWLSMIDSTTLSQSELHALSLSSFNLHSSHDLVTPKIDPSLFNESAGSHRQTYSRPRRHRHVATATTLLPPTPLPSDHRVIIDYLKQLIREDPKFDQVELLSPPSIPEPTFPGGGEERERVLKRKRGRKPKVKVHLEECYRGMEIVNKNGVAIDLSTLANAQDPFADELRRRTEGLQNEEQLLGFLRDLVGQWGSRRKKRRIVDAADFGDVLPLGWKLLLGLKRKDGRAWVYCRRYISPSGQHFVSCKEVSSYLQSLFAHSEAHLQFSHRSENILQDTNENSAGVTREGQDQRQIVATNSDVSGLSVSNERLKEVALLGMDNLADVQIHDLFECHKCSMTFDEKDAYLQHLLSFHQRTTRRYRLGSSVGDGVIIKDGKFECQFCHKVFLERRRYNGHVGIHVRNFVRKVEDSPSQANVQRMDKSPFREEMPSKISKMDALIEIAQNSIMEDSIAEPLNMIPVSEIAIGDLDQDMDYESPISEQQMEDTLTDNHVVQDLCQQDNPHLLVDEEEEEVDDDNQVIDAKMVTFLDNMSLLSVGKQNVNASDTSSKENYDVALTTEGFDQSGIYLEGVNPSPLLPLSGDNIIPESGRSENLGGINTKGQFKLDEDNSNRSELKIGLDGCKDVPVSINVQETVIPASEENLVYSRVSNPSISPEQSLDCFPAFSSDKELRLDEIGTVGYDFASAQDSLSLSLPELANNNVVEGTHASSVQFESQEVIVNVDGRNQLTTVCVWCGIEFNHDAVNSEIQPDSVGFMCPACKAKISGQINVLDSGSPNADQL